MSYHTSYNSSANMGRVVKALRKSPSPASTIFAPRPVSDQYSLYNPGFAPSLTPPRNNLSPNPALLQPLEPVLGKRGRGDHDDSDFDADHAAYREAAKRMKMDEGFQRFIHTATGAGFVTHSNGELTSILSMITFLSLCLVLSSC